MIMNFFVSWKFLSGIFLRPLGAILYFSGNIFWKALGGPQGGKWPENSTKTSDWYPFEDTWLIYLLVMAKSREKCVFLTNIIGDDEKLLVSPLCVFDLIINSNFRGNIIILNKFRKFEKPFSFFYSNSYSDSC